MQSNCRDVPWGVEWWTDRWISGKPAQWKYLATNNTQLLGCCWLYYLVSVNSVQCTVQEHTAQPNPGTRGGSPGGKSQPIVNTSPPPPLVLVIMLPKDVFQLFPPSTPLLFAFQ